MRTTLLPTVHVLVAATMWVPTQQVPCLEGVSVEYSSTRYSLYPGIHHPEETWDQESSPPCEQTDANENITFSKLRWWAVIYIILLKMISLSRSLDVNNTLANSTEDSYLSPCSSLLTSWRAWGAFPSLTSQSSASFCVCSDAGGSIFITWVLPSVESVVLTMLNPCVTCAMPLVSIFTLRSAAGGPSGTGDILDRCSNCSVNG